MNNNKPKDSKQLFPHIHREDFKAGMKDPLIFLAQGLGSGCIWPMPGSWGTLGGLLVYLLASSYIPLTYMLIIIIIACVAGIPLCTYAEKKLGQQDPHSIVWDEWCGIWLAVALVPKVVPLYIVGFFLFRWLDIKKPLLIGWADKKLNHGTGIMLDDILAGIATAIILLAITISTTYLGIP